MEFFGVPSDLDSALMLITKLRNENEEYRSELSSVSATADASVQQLAKLRNENEEYRLMLSSERVAAEASARRHDNKVAEWEAELEMRCQELETLRNKVLTQEDIDVLKFRLVDELEKPHQEHVENLEQELGKFRELYHKTKRDYTMIKEQSDHQRVHSKKFEDELVNLRQAEIDDLRNKNEKLLAEAASSKLDVEIRRLQREKTASDLRISNLSAELDESLAQKENSLREFDHHMRLKDRVTHEQAAKVKQLVSDIDSMRLHVTKLQEELVSSQNRLGEVKKELHESNKLQIQTKTTADEQEHKLRSEISNLKLSAIQRHSEMEREHQVLQDALSTAQRQVHMLEQVTDETTAKLTAKDSQCAMQVHRAREEEWAKQRELEHSKLRLETRNQTLESEKVQLIEDKLKREDARVAETREWSKKVDGLESQVVSLTTESEKFQNKNEELESQLAKSKLIEDDFMKMKTDFETLKRESAATRRTLVEATSSIAVKDGEIQQMNQELDDTRQTLRAEADVVRQTLSDSIDKFTQEKQRGEAAAKELFQKFDLVCQKFKSFKTKAKHERKNLEEVVVGLEDKLEAGAKHTTELEEQLRRTTRELHELQRKLDQFKAVVGNEGVRLAAGMSSAQAHAGLTKPFAA